MLEVPLELTWLGQAGFMIEVASTRLLIDPFLSDHEARLYPPPDTGEVTGGIDWLLVTHEHLDHLDLGFLRELLARSPNVKLILPAPIAEQVRGIVAADQVTGVQPGDSVEITSDVNLEVVPAYHGISPSDGYTDGSTDAEGVRFVGYILRTETQSVYHSGDTIVTEELLHALRPGTIDVALLPINGRDFFREELGLVGNMNYREAVGLCQRVGVRILVPIHWDLFAGNTERPGGAFDEAALGTGLHVLLLARFAAFTLS